MLSPEAQANVDAFEAAKKARALAGVDSRMGARTIGDFALVEPGCELWARTDGDLDQVRMTAEGEARGGIVLEVVDVTELVDAEAGEIAHRRAFRCFDYDPRLPMHRAYTTLTEVQVDPSSFTPPQLHRIRNTYRRLARWVGARNGACSPFEVDVTRDVWILASIIGQR